ncbi:MAG: EamA family transporter [Candidatus Nanohaloarchaea archaeon]|nr:EamA family transporter [Candidatus Nanohaloarchaea archaeon]
MSAYLLLGLAAVLLASYAVYDKVVVFEHVTDEFFLAFTSRIMIFLLVAPFLLLPSVSIPGQRLALISVAAGFLYILSSLVYFTGVKKGDPSTMIVFLNAKPALVVLAAAAFLGEVLHAVQYAGIAVIVGATLLLSVAKMEGKLRLRETAKYGAVFAVVVAGIDLVSKYVITSLDPLAFYALAGIGQGIGGTLGLGYLWLRRRDTVTSNATYPGLRAIAVRSILFVAGLTLFYIALATTPVSIASSIVATQTALTVLFIWLLVRLRKVHPTNLGDVPFSVKLLASLGIMTGVTLISRPEILL